MKGKSSPWSGIARWLQNSVDALIEHEYDVGIDSIPPDVIVDLGLYGSNDERNVYEAYDLSRRSFFDIPVQQFPFLGEKYGRVGLILPAGATISKLVCVRKERDPAEAIREKVNFDLSSSIYNVTHCGDEGDYRYLYVSIIPQKVYMALNEKIRPLLHSGSAVIRAYDRLIPLTRFVVSKVDASESVFCVDQRGDHLTIWNVSPKGDVTVPVNSINFRIPAINPPGSIEGKINMLKNEYMRVYKFVMPKKMVLITNGEPMVAGVLSQDDLIKICTEASRARLIGIEQNKNASITGGILLEG